MNAIKYEMTVGGLDSPPGTISTRALAELFGQMTTAAERSLRLAVEGHSTKTGPSPRWLENATNFVLTGIRKGSTRLEVEAPVLSDAIPDQLVQQDMWGKAPEPRDTAISIISRSVLDVSSENLESDRYDSGLLSSLLEMKPFLAGGTRVVRVRSRQRKEEDFRLDLSVIEKVENLKKRTPDPRAFILSGVLEQIGYSKRRFLLSMKDAQTIPGQIDENVVSVEDLRKLWGKPVTAKGVVNFRPSGRIRLFEAQTLRQMEQGEEVYTNTPAIQTELEFARSTPDTINRRDWLKDVSGKWPGEEPIEELLRELRSR